MPEYSLIIRICRYILLAMDSTGFQWTEHRNLCHFYLWRFDMNIGSLQEYLSTQAINPAMVNRSPSIATENQNVSFSEILSEACRNGTGDHLQHEPSD